MRIELLNGFVESFFDKRRGKWRLLRHNKWTDQRETFYNDKDQMMEWDTEPEAWAWYGRWIQNEINQG